MTDRGPRWLDIPCTFTCEPLLFVLGRMLPRGRKGVGPTVANTPTEAARRLATELSREVIVVDDNQLLVMLDEPFEAVAAARTLDLKPERCIASGLALELLQAPSGASQYTWTWLCQQLKIADAPSYSQGLVQLGIERQVLPAGIDEIPVGPGVWLWMLEGEGDDRVVFVDREQTLGRARDGWGAGIALRDKLVSTEHVTIRPFQGTWALEDRASMSGTFLEGLRVAKRCLVPGMVFHIGASKLVVLSVR